MVNANVGPQEEVAEQAIVLRRSPIRCCVAAPCTCLAHRNNFPEPLKHPSHRHLNHSIATALMTTSRAEIEPLMATTMRVLREAFTAEDLIAA